MHEDELLQVHGFQLKVENVLVGDVICPVVVLLLNAEQHVFVCKLILEIKHVAWVHLQIVH